ncbi:MAG TPA: hypothetical protein VEZ40_17320 [Pyrinomonadaceae bacterium]|nr:hypothetical protein [Pyrinomonadaceae bacterium]
MKPTKTRAATAAAAAAVLVLLALSVAAPVSGGQKLKNKKKEKRFEPIAKQRIADYAGRYVGIMPDYFLEIATGADGQLSITSREGDRRATLRDIRLAGARLTTTRVYPDGATKEFEATFATRILNGESSFGILVENVGAEFEGMTLTRIFYRLDPML